MELPIHLLYIFALLTVAEKATGNGNYSVIEDLRQPEPTKQTEIQPISSLFINKKEENRGDTLITTDSKINSRVKRQYYDYDNGYYYGRNRYYPYPLPIFVGSGIFGGRGFYGRGFGGRGFGGRGFGGRGFGGRGFGGRGFGGRGIGGRGGIGGIGGPGVGGGRGGGGGRG